MQHPPPPVQQVVELLSRAPNFMTLQPMVKALHENFPHAPVESRRIWEKAADDLVLRWVRESSDVEETTFYYNATLTTHSWPSKKGREKIQEAVRARFRHHGVIHVL